MSTSIGSILDDLIKEAMSPKHGLTQKALEEKEKQSAGEEEGDVDLDLDLFVDDEEGDGGEKKVDVKKTSKTMTDDMEAMKSVPELEDVIEKLNVLRSGQSLKDEEVGESFRQYFESLSKAEKVAMFVFLKGISQIVTGEFTGEQAADPADDPANIQMSRDQEGSEGGQSKTIKPNVIKKPEPPEGKKTSDREEDTSPPIPIHPSKK